MNQITPKHRNDLDLLKGFAILAVVLYHMEISASGYLGVDAFFVVNGFLIVPKVVRDVATGQFRYFPFLKKRIIRLLPLLLLASAIALLAGCWGMLPDDYENLSQSVVATNFFSNNILAAITTRDYWDVVNEFKPLMHTWYIGILFEFYLLFPLIIMATKRLSQWLRFGFYKYVVITITAFSIVSFLLYLNPSVSAGDRFYLLPYRFFELAFGGLAGMWIIHHRQGRLYNNGVLSGADFIVLLLLMFAGIWTVAPQETDYNIVSAAVGTSNYLIPQNILLLLTVLTTLFFVVCDNTRSRLLSGLIKVGGGGLCALGALSYSILIWHQPLLAFYRYYISTDFTPLFIAGFLLITLALSYISYRWVEQKVKETLWTKIVLLLAFVAINGAAFVIYLNAGVVRDVPELYVRKNDVHRNMFAEYNARIYAYDIDFPQDNDKINVLVIGNSFARDWGNILLESEMADKINLSYIDQIDKKHIDRIRQSNRIFVFNWKHEVPYYVWENIGCGAEVWGIGTKNYGSSNGHIYKNRHRADYFQQTTKINPDFFILNDLMKEEWGDKYIDLLSMSSVGDGAVIVFSQDLKFLSQDTRHLTQGGAKYYAKVINFERIFRQ